MIRLDRAERPKELTVEMMRQLTEDFIASGKTKAVWKKPWITSTLLASSYGKCAFSEVKLNVEGKYMQVEHFHPKSKYPNEVVKWENLLPCLNVCNSKKGDFDTVRQPLVNPFEDDPKQYFYISNGRIYAKDALNRKATLSILKYDLNNNEQLRSVRYDIENKIKKILLEFDIHYEENPCFYADKLYRLLHDSGRKSEYSATKSTIILGNEHFKHLKQRLNEDGTWNETFKRAESELEFCSLPY